MTAGSFNPARAAQRNAQKAMKSGHIPSLLAAFSVFVPEAFKGLKRRTEHDREESRREYLALITRKSPPVDGEPEPWGTRHNRRWRHKL